MKILVIGAGNMGMTYIDAFINSHIVKPEELMVLEKSYFVKHNNLKDKNIREIHSDPSIVKQAELIIIAVKPQDSTDLFKHIKPFISDNHLVLSIMAGITIKTIKDHLKVSKVIRAMPNLPAQIGVGMTAFTSTDAVSKSEEQTIQNLLQTTGKAIYVKNEQLINAVTAISGSGPAYVYYMMEALMRAAQDMGLSGSVAELMVEQTFSGALDLLKVNTYDCKTWIEKVASKGGTTEAALKSFEANQLDSAIIDGAKAAFNRAEELGK